MSNPRLTPPTAPVQPTGGDQHASPEDLVLYAMQLLPGDQAEAIDRHTRPRAACREELARIYGDLAIVALSSDTSAPNLAVRNRLLAQVAQEKKIVTNDPNRTFPTPATPAGASAPRPLAEFGRANASTLVADSVGTASPRPPAFAWAGWAVAAVFAVITGMLYMSHRSLQESLATESSQIERLNTRAGQSHQLMDALTDPQAKHVMLAPRTPPRGPIGAITYNAEKGTLVFLANNLDPVQTYKTYELWIMPADGSAPIPAGTFHPDEHGSASVIMPKLRNSVKAKAFGVTIEDAGGADKPTMPIIMSGS